MAKRNRCRLWRDRSKTVFRSELEYQPAPTTLLKCIPEFCANGFLDTEFCASPLPYNSSFIKRRLSTTSTWIDVSCARFVLNRKQTEAEINKRLPGAISEPETRVRETRVSSLVHMRYEQLLAQFISLCKVKN